MVGIALKFRPYLKLSGISCGLAVLGCGAILACASARADVFAKDIQPLVAEYCVACHNPDELKGDLDLARFATMDDAADAGAIWNRVAKRLIDKDMPPKRAPQLEEPEVQKILEWVKTIDATTVECDRVVSEETVSWYPGYVMSRRMNRTEYENTIRDLFGVALSLADRFPADGAGGEGFDNSGNALFISSILAEKYLDTADYVVETLFPTRRNARNDDALPEDVLAAVRARILVAAPGRSNDSEITAMRTILTTFLERAWRRPLEAGELDRMMGLLQRAQDRNADFEEQLKLALKAALISPNFIFLAEPHPPAKGVYPLGDFQYATRLSYFLWASMPDDELFAAAQAGGLNTPEQIQAQVHRMLRDPKARALGEVFATQWLGISQLGQTTRPDAQRYKEFDDGLQRAMLDEAIDFFHRIAAENRSLLELVQSDYTYVNERLAAVYGIEGIKGETMRLVSLNDPNRGGVTGMAAVLTATSHPLRTSPVLRGKWVLEQLLGDRVPPPPPNVPQLPEDEKHLDGLTLRQRLEVHRENPDCASCHARMDPIGFGLENYDPIGRWRTDQGGLPLDAKGILPSGEEFEGPQGLKAILLARKSDVARNLAAKMLGFALGRPLTKYDTCVVDECMKALDADDYRAGHLFTTIALSHPFRHRYSAGASEPGAHIDDK